MFSLVFKGFQALPGVFSPSMAPNTPLPDGSIRLAWQPCPAYAELYGSLFWLKRHCGGFWGYLVGISCTPYIIAD